VVDDSAVVRQALQAVLGRAGMQVEAASDPLIAMRKMEQGRPDVIVLDLEMPRMDGLSFLRKVMAEDPLPVVICSVAVGSGTRNAVRAMEEGAVAIVAKPQVGLQGFLLDSALMIEETVRGAALARVPARAAPAEAVPAPGPGARAGARGSASVVAMGASTGGTEALREILQALPPEAPGIVIVQHMPAGFTRAFADRLDDLCRLEVKEAADGDRVVPGRALLAPGNRHLEVEADGRGLVARLSDGPLVGRHRPSVDVLFRSVAAAAGPAAVGVILSGMGADGAEGLLEMKRAGARTIGQDEASCVVFGMPREAARRGAVDRVAPPPRIAPLVMALATLR